MRPCIVLFAKAPAPGRVKTRLSAMLNDRQTVEIHEAFVRDMLEKLLPMEPRADVELHPDPPTDAGGDIEVSRHRKIEGDLGARMYHAMFSGLGEGRPHVLIVGSDAPTLPPGHLRRLLESTADVALGPSEDGGYYAIACRRTDPEMFAGVEWSSPRALEQTVRACEACGLAVTLGEAWHDVDTPEDLARLAGESGVPWHTRAWIGRYRSLFT